MNNAVDHLADTIQDVSQQLSRNIPKQYGQMVKEYVYHHSVNLAFAIGWFVFFLVVIIILSKVFYKSVRLYDKQELTTQAERNLWISGTALVISIVGMIFSIFALREEIRNVIAPDYNMLYDIFYNLRNISH